MLVDNAKDRVNEAFNYLRLQKVCKTQSDLAEALGYSRANVSAALNGNTRYLTDSFLRRFAAAYSDYINEDWLLSGSGHMEVPDRSLVPHFEAHASAGFMGGDSRPEFSPELRPAVAELPRYDFTISVSGDSMTPLINDGDTLACRRLTDSLNPPIGHICLLDLRDGPLVKLISSLNRDSITLRSLNPHYSDIRVPFPDILGIARVVGLIRRLE